MQIKMQPHNLNYFLNVLNSSLVCCLSLIDERNISERTALL